MFASGFLFVLLGLLAEMPQGIASLHGLSVGSMPGSGFTRDLVILGCLLNCFGLAQMARAKGRSWAPAILGLLAIPGSLVGLAVVLLLKSRLMAKTRDAFQHGY